MAAASFGFFPLLMMLLGGGAGGDFLDYVPAEAYFKAAGIEFSAPALVKVLEAPVPEAAAARPADSARRQLALRSLAELEAKQALPTIEKYVGARDPLTADYAKRARAALGGAAYRSPTVDREDLQIDLGYLPSGVAAIGQLKTETGERVDMVKAMMKMMAEFAPGGPNPDGPDPAEMQKQMEKQLIEGLSMVMAKVGNFRLHALTFGLAGNVADEKGFVVLIARGIYDHDSLSALLGDRIGSVRRKSGGLTYFELSSNAAYVAPVSDELLVFIGGASIEELPLQEVGTKISTGGGDFAIGGKLARLLGKIDRSAALWLAVEVTEAYAKAPPLKPFETLSLVIKGEGESRQVEISAVGQNPEAAKEVVEEMENGLAQLKEALAGENVPAPQAKQIAGLLEGIELSREGGSAELKIPVPSVSQAGALPMLLLFGATEGLPGPDDEPENLQFNELEELKEIPPEEAEQAKPEVPEAAEKQGAGFGSGFGKEPAIAP